MATQDILSPFFRPIAHLIADPDITEIMVVGGTTLFIERQGRLYPLTDITLDERALTTGARLLFRSRGKELTEEEPLQDTRFPDGSRVSVVLPPCSVSGLTLTIRKFGTRRYDTRALVEIQMVSARMLDHLRDAMTRRANILISGATSVGKTTMLNALAQTLPAGERIIVIEETAEIFIAHPHVVRLEARAAQADMPAVTIRDLLRATLRQRPDRLIIGEVRGAEAHDFLAAMGTGHDGSLCTIHARDARRAAPRLASCARQANELPYETICLQIADSIDFILHLDRRDGVRRARELVRLCGYDIATGAWQCETVCDETGASPGEVAPEPWHHSCSTDQRHE